MRLFTTKICRSGASAVEFALVLPILLLLLFGIIEYGWLLTNQIVMTNAVSAGARAGIKAEDEDEAQNYAKAATKDAFWPAALSDVNIQTDILDDNPRRIEVKISSFPYTPLTGFLPSALIPDHLAAKAVMAFP